MGNKKFIIVSEKKKEQLPIVNNGLNGFQVKTGSVLKTGQQWDGIAKNMTLIFNYSYNTGAMMTLCPSLKHLKCAHSGRQNANQFLKINK